MLSFPKVHVLMPAYNAKAYISGAIQSVLTQNYPNLKLLIVNDGSTDNLSEIMGSEIIASAVKCKKIHYEEASSNKGIAKTRSRLLEWSKILDPHAYLLWLDADDKYIEKTFVSDIIQQMQKTRAEICLYNFLIRYEDEGQRANAAGLIKDRENSISVINNILSLPEKTVAPDELPTLLEFTSLGWTKCYAPTIKIPDPANCPYEDFVYMAALLQAKSVTALPAERTPVEYLRRSTSICGQRTHKNFESDIPTQLKLFFDRVVEDSRKTRHQFKKLTMAQNFVKRKFELYILTLNNILSAATPIFPSITGDTLTVFQTKKDETNQYMIIKIEKEKIARKKSAMKPLLVATAATGFYIAYRICTARTPTVLPNIPAQGISRR